MTTYKHAVIAESLRDDPRNDIDEGTRTLHLGEDPDPEYTVVTDDGAMLKIPHRIVKRIKAPEPKTEQEMAEYIRSEVLPLEGDE